MANTLKAQHEARGAEMQPYADIDIVATFGEPQAEYASIHKACGLMDRPERAILEATGKDRLSFLNNFLTNQTWDKSTKTPIPPGTGAYAFLLSGQGRVVADMNVLEQGDRTWLEMDARKVEDVRKLFDKYLFTEQAKFSNRSADLHELALYGPGALDLLNAHASSPIHELPPIGSARLTLFGAETLVWRDDPAGVPGYHLILPEPAAASVWDALLKPYEHQPNKRALRPVGWAAFNAARIEAGRSLFGIDFDESVLPAETGQLERAVSFTKGCYLGQEIVARMHARGQFAKRLVGIKMDGEELPIASAQIFDDKQNAIGGVTSSTMSPLLSRAAICLGYVKKPFVNQGTPVHIPAEGAIRKGTVVNTPFV